MNGSGKLRWGVLGGARINRKVIPALQASENGEVVGIASRDEAKAKEQAETYGVPQAFGSYEALLASSDVEAVYVPLPNSLHLEWTLKALDAGKHVLCEKPLAMSAAECEQVRRKADETGLTVLEGFMYRFHPRFELLLELLQQKAVGDVTFIRVAHSFAVSGGGNIRFSSRLGGGALLDVGCYCANVSRTLTGEEPAKVSAFANFVDAEDGGAVDASISGALRFLGGATTLFDCGMNLERRNLLEVVGTAGRFYLDNPFSLLDEDSVLEEHHFGQDPVLHKVKSANPFVQMAEHFAESVLNGTPLRYSLQDSVNNAYVLDALARAARKEAGA